MEIPWEDDNLGVCNRHSRTNSNVAEFSHITYASANMVFTLLGRALDFAEGGNTTTLVACRVPY